MVPFGGGQNGGLAKVNSDSIAPPILPRPAAEDRVGSLGVVAADPASYPGSYLTAGLEGIEVDASAFQ